jgi:Zona pellucida-like domain.
MVMCSEQHINVTLQTVEPFKGRIYVAGHSDTCNSEGSGQYTTMLKIPMSGSGSSNQCGIMIIKSFGETNQYVSCYKNVRIQDSYETIESIYIKSKIYCYLL